jgi:hypothetical protein
MVYMDLIQKLEKRFGFREPHPGPSLAVRPWRYLFHLPSRIAPKGGSKYGLIIMPIYIVSKKKEWRRRINRIGF